MKSDIHDDLFQSLFKWARRQDENFSTEVFVSIFRHLQRNEPKIAAKIFNFLTDSKYELTLKEVPFLNISTQSSMDMGRPDIVIESAHLVIFIEVKLNAGFGDKQLFRYKSKLSKEKYKHTCLVTITKYPLEYYGLTDSELPDVSLRWIDIAKSFSKYKIIKPISKYLIDEFILFLNRSNLIMEKVTYEYIDGMKAYQNLLLMLSESLASLNMNFSRSSGQLRSGFYVDTGKLFIGIYYDWINVIQIITEKPIKDVPIEDITLGKIDGGKWRNILELDSEDIYFFSRSAESQGQCLAKYIKESVEFAQNNLF